MNPKKVPDRREIDAVCKGWSSALHWRFFEDVLRNQSISNICILGVYMGRDIAYMNAAMHRLGRKDWSIVGVDKFEDRYCEDWPEQKRNLSWAKAGFGEAPTLDVAQRNLETLGLAGNVKLIEQRAEEFLAASDTDFDFVYIDTSHDYNTTRDTIRLARKRLRANGLLGGDDYSDEGTWGVKRAVNEAFTNPTITGKWLWLARGSDYIL